MPDPGSTKRDIRIGLMRGLALLFVFTGHISEISSLAGLIAAWPLTPQAVRSLDIEYLRVAPGSELARAIA